MQNCKFLFNFLVATHMYICMYCIWYLKLAYSSKGELRGMTDFLSAYFFKAFWEHFMWKNNSTKIFFYLLFCSKKMRVSKKNGVGRAW